MTTKSVILSSWTTVILLFINFVEIRQSWRVYEDYLSCEHSFDELQAKYGSLPFEISQLEKQLSPTATSESILSQPANMAQE